ncbi:hypothetical protein TK81_25870, partial [Salmonella enterica subsp. enterica]|nr:hypothetical protein [Salmonella enterica subsp. enterica]
FFDRYKAAIYAITGRRARGISLLMKIFEKKADPFFFLLIFCFYLFFFKKKGSGNPLFWGKTVFSDPFLFLFIFCLFF